MEDRISITITAEIVAWYAAFVATIAVTVQLANYLRDRKKAKVTVKKNYKVWGDPHLPGTYTFVDVVNIGRRPFTLTTIGLRYLRGTGAVFATVTPALPCFLSEGQHATAIVDQTGLRHEDILAFEAYDTAGSTFRVYVASWPRRIYWALWRTWKRK